MLYVAINWFIDTRGWYTTEKEGKYIVFGQRNQEGTPDNKANAADPE